MSEIGQKVRAIWREYDSKVGVDGDWVARIHDVELLDKTASKKNRVRYRVVLPNGTVKWVDAADIYPLKKERND